MTQSILGVHVASAAPADAALGGSAGVLPAGASLPTAFYQRADLVLAGTEPVAGDGEVLHSEQLLHVVLPGVDDGRTAGVGSSHRRPGEGAGRRPQVRAGPQIRPGAARLSVPARRLTGMTTDPPAAVTAAAAAMSGPRRSMG